MKEQSGADIAARAGAPFAERRGGGGAGGARVRGKKSAAHTYRRIEHNAASLCVDVDPRASVLATAPPINTYSMAASVATPAPAEAGDVGFQQVSTAARLSTAFDAISLPSDTPLAFSAALLIARLSVRSCSDADVARVASSRFRVAAVSGPASPRGPDA
ncbi:unnamed protein product, partial [Iphiclides podalirius]